MRKIFYAPWPHDGTIIAVATAAGASEILDGEGGYAELPEPGDDPDFARAARLVELAAKRYAASQLCPWRGLSMPTDTQAGTNVLGAIVGLELASSQGPIVWKLGDGSFAPLSFADLVDLGQTMRGHIQACYVREAALSAEIAAAQTVEEIAAVDIDQGWP